MSLTVNTNMQALRIQDNLNSATEKMNTAMERMSSGSKINSAKDDAAGLAVSTTLSKTISGSKIASSNVKIGQDMLSTAEGSLDVILTNLTRVRDLTEQAANGTYSASDRTAISSEITARMGEVNTLASAATFNGNSLFKAGNTAVSIQSGTGAGDQTSLDATIFAAVDVSALSTAITTDIGGGVSATIAGHLTGLDTAISDITGRQTAIGAAQNQLTAVSDGLTVQQTNLTSALSTIKDADVAEESASYVQNQILQQASASLLVQANSAPQIALTLIKG
jgi:flagellin